MSLLSTLFTRSRKYRIRELRNKYPGYAIGRASYGSPEIVTWGNDGSLRIGSFCSFAPGVKLLLGGEHRMDWVTTYPFNVVLESASGIEGHPHSKGDIVIGKLLSFVPDILFIEGNYFATTFDNLTPPFDDNMVYAFHKYWNGTDQGSIHYLLNLRNRDNVPIWAGETG